MNTKRKLTTWYFMIIFALTLLVSIMYFVMIKIEGTTQILEKYIRERNLSYVVNKNYEL